MKLIKLNTYIPTSCWVSLLSDITNLQDSTKNLEGIAISNIKSDSARNLGNKQFILRACKHRYNNYILNDLENTINETN